MRIEQLEINKFRGIPEMEVEPDGDNLCLLGPNGSGKSSVIEAVDFLLTGTIKDLTGEGTGDISIPKHGTHLRGEPEDAWVAATFSDDDQSFTIRRTMANRNSLEYDGDLPAPIQNLMESADKGQHYLSRREILNFIVARKQSRSDQLRSLLDLDTIREKRLELQGAADNLDSRASQLEREQDSTKNRILDLFEDASTVDGIFPQVNELRNELGGDPLDELSEDTTFRSGIDSPTERASASPIQSTRTLELLETIRMWFEGEANEFWSDHNDVKSLVTKVRNREEALRDLEVVDLIRRGRNQIDEQTEACPLCLTPWDYEELEDLLEQREAQAEEAKALREDIDEVQTAALEKLTSVRTAVESLVEILSQHDDFTTKPLEDFSENLREVEEGLGSDLIEEVPLEDVDESGRQEKIEPEGANELVDRYLNLAESLPDLGHMEEVWDDLHSGHDYYSQFVELEEEAQEVRQAANEMEAVKGAFVEARDEILTETYEAISDRFEEFYTTLHHDEGEFSPSIEPTETGLDIQVGFHGEGQHPPHALHSEGHQDSMGVCLFLALCDYLEGDDLSLIMLDDVVMSIDAEHRRPLAQLLKEDISTDFQLMITTHDELWYRHLKSSGVVTSTNTVKFTEWSIADGPIRVDELADGWDRIDGLLDEGDVEGAAHRLRHTSEWFLREACDQLCAEVQFKADGLWTLGDFMGPALAKFRDSIKKAKVAEESWGKDISDINELDDERSDVYERLNMEQGAVNPNVHFNENQWATFTPSEMRDVVAAFRDLYDLFWCGNCGSGVKIAVEDYEEVRMECICGQKANWTLQEKP